MHLNVNDWFDKGSLVKKMAANEEQLAMAMYKYSVVFGKSNKNFYRKDIKRNAWKAFAEELGLENGDLESYVA